MGERKPIRFYATVRHATSRRHRWLNHQRPLVARMELNSACHLVRAVRRRCGAASWRAPRWRQRPVAFLSLPYRHGTAPRARCRPAINAMSGTMLAGLRTRASSIEHVVRLMEIARPVICFCVVALPTGPARRPPFGALLHGRKSPPIYPPRYTLYTRN